MHTPRIYIDTPISVQKTVKIEGPKHHHLKHVLRLKVADSIVLFNGQGGEFIAKIDAMARHETWAMPFAHDPSTRESTLHTCLLLSIIKRDAMISALQRATELGVTEILPIKTQYLSDKYSQLARRQASWQNTIENASEQCGRTKVPKLHEIVDFEFAVNAIVKGTFDLRLIAHPGQTDLSLNLEKKINRVAVFVGPEGGFSDQEIAIAEKAQLFCYSLGPRVLRSETAPAAILATLQAQFGDFASILHRH